MKINKHIPSLDGIRALATTLVLLSHWDYPYFGLKLGWIGVNLFFVLSGFLITRILLGSTNEGFLPYIKKFIRNRSLRVFPIYFFYLLISFTGLLILVQVFKIKIELLTQALSTFEHSWKYLFTYTFNFEHVIEQINHDKIYLSNFYGHFWSLSIEEQFYLFYPFLVYFAPKKYLKIVLISIIILSPFTRYFAGEFLLKKGLNNVEVGWAIYFNTFTQMDALAMGGVLATLKDEYIHGIRIKFWISFIVTFLVGIISMMCIKWHGGNIPTKTLGFNNAGYWFNQDDTGFVFFNLRYTYLYSLLNLTAMLFIVYVKQSERLRKVFENTFLRSIGKISYGLYVYHFFIAASVTLVIEYCKDRYDLQLNIGIELLFLILYLSLTFFIASLSYKYFETYFLKLKEKPPASVML